MKKEQAKILTEEQLLEKTLIGQLYEDYELHQKKPIILKTCVYADCTQGKVLFFHRGFCWQAVYGISKSKDGLYSFEHLDYLSGILEFVRKEEKNNDDKNA